ncbi:MAG TPA: type II toxin-antitoxin system RelE/ParE family toxin [Azospirillaceae bacterium]|nr:type II toxin-antitoxin system RelE/ParE family toxin [Azospirillaceae bacterium]
MSPSPALKRITARFYRTAAGNQPVRDWLIALAAADRKVVGADIAEVEFAWPIGKPVCSPLGQGLYEVRSTIRNGKVEARIIFGIDGDTMVLLHGHEKKPSQQSHEIAVARDRWRDYQAAGRGV